jgi:TonB family protein
MFANLHERRRPPRRCNRAWSEEAMLRRTISFSIIAAALLPAQAAQAKPPETLARSTNWAVDRDSDACHLQAEFGEGEKKVIMRITRHGLGEGFKIRLYGNRFATDAARGEAKVDFGLAPAPAKASGIFGTARGLGALFLSEVTLDGWPSASREQRESGITPEQETSVSGATFRISRMKPFRLEFGSLGQPFAQLRACQSDLVRSWGYDPEVQRTLSRSVKSINNVADWLSSSDYPAVAVARRYNGTVQIRLDVDAEGKVAGCHVLERTRPDVFADITCQAVTKRARLEPALDSAGRPVRSYFTQSITWVMGN